MIEISAQVFWAGILLLVGVQVFSLVFERMMMYRVIRDLQNDIRELSMNFAQMSSAMQKMLLRESSARAHAQDFSEEIYRGATTEREPFFKK